MSAPAYVAVDWGTSSFRLWLVDRDGQMRAERRSDDGMVAAARTGFPAVLAAHLAAVSAAPDLPVLICGMAGARQGWVEAGYIDTPTPLSAILAQAVSVPGQSRDIRILPGIAQRDPGAPDVMRGEETQLLGALGLGTPGDAVVCMPGTHSKWVAIRGGRVAGFSTYMTGELFGAISRETILSHAVAHAEAAEETAAFRTALLAAFANPARFANLLFRVRSAQLLFGGTPSVARETISGTLIGLELAAERPGLGGGAVMLIASGPLAQRYRLAIESLALDVTVVDADDAVRRGLSMAARAIWTR